MRRDLVLSFFTLSLRTMSMKKPMLPIINHYKLHENFSSTLGFKWADTWWCTLCGALQVYEMLRFTLSPGTTTECIFHCSATSEWLDFDKKMKYIPVSPSSFADCIYFLNALKLEYSITFSVKNIYHFIIRLPVRNTMYPLLLHHLMLGINHFRSYLG